MKHKFFNFFSIILFCFIAVGNIFPQQLVFNDGMPDLEFGQPFHFKYYLSATESTGHIQLVADLDDQGGFDSTWHPIDMGRPFVDNGPTDLNDTVGVYESDFYNKDVPVSEIVNVSLALIVEDGGGMDFAIFTVFYDTASTPLADVHGQIYGVTNPAGLVVVAEAQMGMTGPIKSNNAPQKLMVVTLVKPDGSYGMQVPAYNGSVNYMVGSDDYIYVLNTPLIPPQQVEIVAQPGDTHNIDFTYTEPSAFIEGNVFTNDNLPIPGANIHAELIEILPIGGGGPFGKSNNSRLKLNLRAIADSTGHYVLGAIPGTWRINASLDGTPVFGQYMNPGEIDSIRVKFGETIDMVNFAAYPINATFSGTVTWEGAPYSGLEVYAWSPDGYNSAVTDSSGYYEIGVNSQFMYYLNVNDNQIPPGYDLIPNGYNGVTPGANFDFEIGMLPSTIEGYVYDANTSMPIPGADIYINEKMLVKDGNMPFGKSTQTDSSGYYFMTVPNGDFNIHVDAHQMGYFPADSFFTATDTSITMDFFLTAQLPGYILGNVQDYTGNPLDSAWVGAIPEMVVKSNSNKLLDDPNQNFPFAAYTDAAGDYELKLPPGSYVIVAGKPGFVRQFYDHADAFSNANSVQVMESDTVFAVDFDLNLGVSLSGSVFSVDGDTVRGGQVVAVDTNMTPRGGPVKVDNEFHTDIMFDGTYTFDALPPGTYFIIALSEGYEPQYYDNARFSGEATAVDIQSGTPVTGIDFELVPFNPAPDLLLVKDVPMDQGLQVQLAFRSSSLDNPIFMEMGIGDFQNGIHINKYSVWRSLSFMPGDSVMQAVGTLEDLLKSNTELNSDSKFLRDGMLWTFVGEVPAIMYLPVYGYVAPTLHDSSAVNDFLTAFTVIAHADDMGLVFPGKPMLGYSVDNLKPDMPGNLTVTPADQAAELTWEAVDAPDLIYYRVYRSETQGFVPTADDLVGETEDISFIDSGIQPGTTYYYVVSAVDDAFNETPSNEVTLAVTGVEDEGIPTEFSLDQNYPNPFNPTTTIRFGLPKATHVKIFIYSILGEKVATILDENREAGYHRIEFDASRLSSGLYIYQIQAGDFKQVRKMMLMK